MITRGQLQSRLKVIKKDLDVAFIYYIDGAPASAAGCLIAAIARLGVLLKDVHEASIEKARALASLPRKA